MEAVTSADCRASEDLRALLVCLANEGGPTQEASSGNLDLFFSITIKLLLSFFLLSVSLRDSLFSSLGAIESQRKAHIWELQEGLNMNSSQLCDV
jgi:hypothetical protein